MCPNDSHTEYVINRGLEEGIADFLLCTGGTKADFVCELAEKYPDHVSIHEAENPDAAAALAVQIVREGKADVLMKGTINTDNLLRAVLNKEHGLLEKGRVMTHVTVAQMALIHCTEKVSEKFPHTLSYETLMKKAKEGAYGDVVVDGPMDVKTACDADSGAIKGIASPVVGNADALIFPNIESGNVFYKTITLFGGAETAGMLYGTTAPIVVASRADSGESKFYSLAVACISHK